jgi:hypothetical protein
MKTEELIRIDELCLHYEVEPKFFLHLHEIGLIEISVVQELRYIHITQVAGLERMVRLHHDLQLNPEGMDVVFNLLQKIDGLQAELLELKNRLRLYEE